MPNRSILAITLQSQKKYATKERLEKRSGERRGQQGAAVEYGKMERAAQDSATSGLLLMLILCRFKSSCGLFLTLLHVPL